MPKPNKQSVNHNSIVLGFSDGGPDLTIPQSELRSLHAQQNGNQARKNEVVIDRVKVKLYERMGGLPAGLDIPLDGTLNDGTVANIIIEN